MKFPRIFFWLVCFLPFLAACTAIKMDGFFQPCQGPSCPTPTNTRKPQATIIAIRETMTNTQEAVDRPLFPESRLAPTQSSLVLAPDQEMDPTLSPHPSPTPDPIGFSKLLYISKGSLFLFDRIKNEKTLIAAYVSQFSVSRNGRRLVYLQNKQITANAEQLYELYRYDLLNGQSTQLMAETPQLYHLTISPDGRYLAYATQADGGEIITLSTDRSSSSIPIGHCEPNQPQHCKELLWSPDGQGLVWNDLHGIWFSYLSNGKAKLVSPDKIEVIDPKGKKSPVSVGYFNLAWSPTGRFALVQVGVRGSDVMWDAVLDTRNGRLSPVPGTYQHQDLKSQSGWLQDGSIYVAQAAKGLDQPLPSIQIWRVTPTSKDVLTLLRQVDIKTEETDGFPRYQELFVLPGSSCQLEDSLVVIGLSPADENFPPGIFGLDIKSGEIRQVITLPDDISRIMWSPDRSGAILLGWHQQVLFAAMDGSRMDDLRPQVGRDAQQFAWIPNHP